MSLQDELGLNAPIQNPRHETLMSVMLTGAMLAKEGDRLLNPFGLTDSQFNVLMLLRYQAQDGYLTQTQLGRMLLVNRSNVTGLIDRMERAGWVQRTTQSGDRRIKRIQLTPTGRRLVERAEGAYFARIEQITADLSRSDLEQLKSLLATIRQATSRTT